MNAEQLRHKLLGLIYDTLARTFLVTGENRMMLMALKGYLLHAPEEVLEDLLTYIPRSQSMSDVAAMETAALETKAAEVGLPAGLIIALVAKFGPMFAKLLISLLLKKAEMQAAGMEAPGDAQAFKTQLGRVLDLAAYGAKLTATETDDRAVATLGRIVENTDLVEFVFYLLGK